jgi:dihydroorotase/N-acyl-D-amino-acid deacylase
VIDVHGNVIAPGFIDIHTHARRGITQAPTAPNYARQGVTTVMEGPDGSSPLPLAPFLAQMERCKTSINIGSFVGQGSCGAPSSATSTARRRPRRSRRWSRSSSRA